MALTEVPFENVLKDVLDFMAKGQPEELGNLVDNPSEDTQKLAYRLIREEVVVETLSILGHQDGDGEINIHPISVEQKHLLLDGIIDSIYVLLWTAVAFGFHKQDVFWNAWKAVQFANMDKFRNGVIRDSMGKIQKPEGWEAPDETIKELVFNASAVEYAKKYPGEILSTGLVNAKFYGKDG